MELKSFVFAPRLLSLITLLLILTPLDQIDFILLPTLIPGQDIGHELGELRVPEVFWPSPQMLKCFSFLTGLLVNL